MNTKQELNDAFQNIYNYYMIENFSIISISSYNKYQEEFYMFGCYPNRWITQYKEKQYYLIDPVLQTVEKTKTPFSWHVEEFNNISPEQSKFLMNASNQGVGLGTTIPLLSVNNTKEYLTILNEKNLHCEAYYSLSYLASFYLHFMRKAEFIEGVATLTQKELSITSMKSKGYSVKQVSYELGVTEATVIFHLKNIRLKMNTKNTEQSLYQFGCVIGEI